MEISKDTLHVPNGPITRSKTKTLKEALNALVLKVSTKLELKGPLEYQEETLVYLIHVQEGSNTTLFGPWSEDNKGNKRIILQLGNNMSGYLFLLFLGLRGCMEGYKYALNQFCNILLHYFLLMAKQRFNIRGFIFILIATAQGLFGLN